MKEPTKLESLQMERNEDTEWLGKYKKIVDGLKMIAEIHADNCNNDIDAWASVYHGLNLLSDLMQEDIDSRKEEK